MNLKEIASIAGKGGLFRILKPTRSGVIVESLDEKKHKMAVSASNRISILEEISVYTTTSEGSVPLKEVFTKIYQEFQDDPGVTGSSSSDELKSFIQFILPDYDENRVYVSDIKKIVTWYNLLIKHIPELFTEPEHSEKSEENTSGESAATEEAAAENKTAEEEAAGKKEKSASENQK